MTIYFFVILAVCVLDQLTKVWALDFLSEVSSKTVIDGVLDFTFVKNDGMAFGLLGDHRWVFMVLSTVGILAMLAYLIYLKGNGKLFCFSLSLVIGGGIGNMFDRVALGYVVDFIDVTLFGKYWTWVFNVADSAICIGAVLLMLAVILEEKKK